MFGVLRVLQYGKTSKPQHANWSVGKAGLYPSLLVGFSVMRHARGTSDRREGICSPAWGGPHKVEQRRPLCHNLKVQHMKLGKTFQRDL
jgi:hypothetical protein